MIKHYVFWNLDKELSVEERANAAMKIKSGLESLKDKIDGIIEIVVVINNQDSSTRDIALLSEFSSKEALDAYQIHPEHNKVAGFIKSVTCERVCFDF